MGRGRNRFRHSWNRPIDHAVQHDRLETQFRNSMLQLSDGFFRFVHRYDCSRRDSILQWLEELSAIDIESATCCDSCCAIVDSRKSQTHGWVENCKVDPEFIQSLIQEPRHHGGCPVSSVPSRRSPEGFLRNVFMTPLPRCHSQALRDPTPVGLNSLDRIRSAYLAHRFHDNRSVLQPMSVSVNDGVTKT